MRRILSPALILFVAAVISIHSHAITCESLFLQASNQVAWFEQISFRDTEKVLSTAKVIEIKPLREALHESGKRYSGSTQGMLVITFADGTKALWKPGQSGRIEEAAYRAARKVRSKLVPPTVFRTFTASSFSRKIPSELASSLIGISGSLQFFVHTPIDLPKMPGAERQQAWSKVPVVQRAERDIFNFVFGNWDLHWGNVLVDASFSIAQIDNGAIRSRQQVTFGQLPFVRRMSIETEVQTSPVPAFPFSEAIYLERPSLLDFISLMQSKVVPKDLANYVRSRLQNAEIPVSVLEDLANLIRSRAPIISIQKFLKEHPELMFAKDLTMQVAFWDRGVWIQGIGFQNYKPIIPQVFSKNVVDAYRQLTFEDLRSVFPEDLFSDIVLNEMLGRRDQIVAASETTRKSATD